MLLVRTFAFALLLVSTSAAGGQELACGTGAATQRRAEEVASFVRRTQAATAALVAGEQPPTTRFLDDVLLVRADELTVPFDDPADLEGMSLFFRRVDAKTFAVRREPLAYDAEMGALFESFGRGTTSRTYTLNSFAFPFGDEARSQLTLSVTRGIHFTAAPQLPAQPFGAFAPLMDTAPIIAPLLDYLSSPAPRPDVFVKEASGAVTITWRAQAGGMSHYDVQAVLLANGDMRFHYKTVRDMAWGGVAVHTGGHAWLADRTVAATVNDPVGDVEPIFSTAREMLDITRIDVSRVAGTSMLELRMTLAGAVDQRRVASFLSYLFFVGDSSHRVELFVYPGQTIYRVPNATDTVNSPAAQISGNEVKLYVTEDLLGLQPGSTKIWAYTGTTLSADSVIATVDLGTATATAETDFDSFEGTLLASRPLVETFSLGTVNLPEIWSRLKSEFGYDDSIIDAVAVYSTFPTDLIVSKHGAFALLANPGADGISQFSSSSRPRTATLMNMNSLQFASSRSERTHILLHELGHRWLYYFDILEEGQARRTLNPLGYHPAQWVHTPAAFSHASAADCSAMGGATFTDLGGGKFRAAVSKLGFSWHELYLMGLASPDEVLPWFYLRDTDPRLGDEYHPAHNQVVSGGRTDVGVQQVIGAMGPRVPAYPNTQREFRVLFVVLERADAPVTKVDPAHRADFESAFAAATGNRGRVTTAVSLAAPAASFTTAAAARNVQFTDTSTSMPLSWRWDFGDGTTSAARNPQHFYASAGTYNVTLTVTNGKGSSTTSKVVVVSGGVVKRRSAGR